jgi:hypothetical protein
MPDLAFARAVHLYTAALGVLLPAPAPFDDEPPSRSFFRRAVSALVFDPALLALVPHAALGTVSSLAHLPLYALTLPNMVYPLLYSTDLTSEAAYLELMRPFVIWRIAPCATTPIQTLETLIDRCFGVLATTSDALTGIDLTHLSRFERRVGYADLGVRIHLADGRVAAVDVPSDGSVGRRRAALDDDRAIRRCTAALLTSATVEAHAASIHFALSDRICTLVRALPEKHAARRLLLPLTNKPFFVNETAVPFLLGPRGLCDWTNFTQRGILDLVAHATATLDPSWLLLGHAGECGSSAAHVQAWRACVRSHVRAFLHLQPGIERDRDAASLVAAFARAFPRLQEQERTLEDVCTMALLVPVVHELLSNPWIATYFTNPFTASFIWRDASNGREPLASHLPTLAEQLRVNVTTLASMREAARIDSPEWVERCCVTADERAAYAAFQRSVAALDIPSDAVLHPTNISSSVSY